MLGALAVGFTACEDAPADAPIQTNPQGPVLETSAVALTPAALRPAAFDRVQSVELTLNGAQFEVYPSDLHDAYLDLFGFTTEAKKAYYRVPVTLTTESGAEYRLGAADYYAASGSFTESPMASIMPTDYVYTPGGQTAGASLTRSIFSRRTIPRRSPAISAWLLTRVASKSAKSLLGLTVRTMVSGLRHSQYCRRFRQSRQGCHRIMLGWS